MGNWSYMLGGLSVFYVLFTLKDLSTGEAQFRSFKVDKETDPEGFRQQVLIDASIALLSGVGAIILWHFNL